MNDMPSLFDQLTPDDSLRADLDWLDSLQERPDRESKPARGHGRKNRPAGHDAAAAPLDTAPTTPMEAEPPRTETIPAESPVQPVAMVPPPGPSLDNPEMPDATPDGFLPPPELPTAADGTPRTAPPVPLPAEPATPEPHAGPIPAPAAPGSDAAAELPDELETVSDDAPDRSGVTVWFKRILVGVAALMLLLVAFALIGSHSAATKSQEAHDRLQTSMSRLETATKKASAVQTKAGEAGLDDAKELDELASLIESNTKLARSKRAGLTDEESGRLAVKADKATKRTRKLTAAVSALVEDKPRLDAKETFETALDKARQAAKTASPSDDASRKALDALNTLTGQAGKLGDETTETQYKDMTTKLDQARKSLQDALDAKRKADEQAEAKKQEEAQQQQQQSQQQSQTPSTPQYQPQYHPVTTPSPSPGTSGGSSSGSSSGSDGQDGWYVPPVDNGDSLPNNDPSL